MAPEQSHCEQSLFDSAVRRIARTCAALAGAGCAACLAWRGWKWGLAYLLGAAASYQNFRWLKRLVNGLGPAPQVRLNKKFAAIMGLRYLLLAAGAYVIVNFTSLSLAAGLAGLFVPVAAVIGEIVFELITGSYA